MYKISVFINMQDTFRSVMITFNKYDLCETIKFCKTSVDAANYALLNSNCNWFALTEEGYLQTYPDKIIELPITHFFIFKIDNLQHSIRNSLAILCYNDNYTDYIDNFVLDCKDDLNSIYDPMYHNFEVDIFKIDTHGNTCLIDSKKINSTKLSYNIELMV
jgi:hypothetical protein